MNEFKRIFKKIKTEDDSIRGRELYEGGHDWKRSSNAGKIQNGSQFGGTKKQKYKQYFS